MSSYIHIIYMRRLAVAGSRVAFFVLWLTVIVLVALNTTKNLQSRVAELLDFWTPYSRQLTTYRYNLYYSYNNVWTTHDDGLTRASSTVQKHNALVYKAVVVILYMYIYYVISIIIWIRTYRRVRNFARAHPGRPECRRRCRRRVVLRFREKRAGTTVTGSSDNGHSHTRTRTLTHQWCNATGKAIRYDCRRGTRECIVR